MKYIAVHLYVDLQGDNRPDCRKRFQPFRAQTFYLKNMGLESVLQVATNLASHMEVICSGRVDFLHEFNHLKKRARSWNSVKMISAQYSSNNGKNLVTKKPT